MDFLLDVHNVGYHPELSYERLVRNIQYSILNYVKAFPNLNTIVILLDEQKHVPLGKAPTQGKRGKPLAARERNKILDGGVISSMNPNIEDSIEATYSKEADVVSGKKSAFAVFYERYIRTRELRKDLVVFIANCMIQLVSSGRIPKHIGLYIDGMNVSTYFSSPDQLFSATTDDDGTPLTKRRSSMSVPDEVECHAHEDEKVIPLCKITWTPREAPLALTLDHPYSSVSIVNSPTDSPSPEELGMEVRPLWLRREDGDSELFFGYKGPHQRPNMGESDIKVAYYTRRLAEALAHKNKTATVPYCGTCFVVSADTDILLIMLLNMMNFPLLSSPHFVVALDTRPGGTVRDIVACFDKTVHRNKPMGKRIYNRILKRVVGENERISLTGIADINALTKGIKSYFKVLHPGVRNPVETLCLMFLCCGSDFVDPRPGIGFEKITTVFDLGGYRLLSKAISIRTHVETLPRAKSAMFGRKFSSIKTLSISIDEKKVLSFFNLAYRYALALGNINSTIVALKKEKTLHRSELAAIQYKLDKLKNIKSDKKPTKKVYSWENEEDIETLEKLEKVLERKHGYSECFFPKEHYTTLFHLRKDPRKLREQIHMNLGITENEHMDWDAVETTLTNKRKQRAETKRDRMITQSTANGTLKEKEEYIKGLSQCDLLAQFKNRAVTDMKSREELIPPIRRIGWNLAYWSLSSFVCTRDTKHLNSMCRLHGNTRYSVLSPQDDNHKIDDYFEEKSYPAHIQKPRKRSNGRLSMNGFTRVYEPETKTSKKRKLQVVLSPNIYPPARVTIDLVSAEIQGIL